MPYLLKEQFLLRGWELLPHAVVDTGAGRAVFTNDATFQALSFCDGVFDTAHPVLLPIHRKIFTELLKNGVIEETRGPRPVKDFQKYRRFPCRCIAQAHWSITGRCNYRCRHCYMSAPEAGFGELPHEQCLSIVQQLADAGVYRVSLTGGEPLVRGRTSSKSSTPYSRGRSPSLRFHKQLPDIFFTRIRIK
jgi:sulfatase maturation enzyme AslB (radical SAM superfamily)